MVRSGSSAQEGCAQVSFAPRVLMYTTAVCPFCIRAEKLLRARGVAEIEKIRVDLEPERRIEMVERTGRRTVPQIYIGDTHVGGADDLVALDRSGKLCTLLTPEGA